MDVQYTLDDFTMLRGMRTVSLMVVVNPKTSGFQIFDDVLSYGKDSKITYATSSGPGGDSTWWPLQPSSLWASRLNLWCWEVRPKW